MEPRKVSWSELFFDLVFVAAAHSTATHIKNASGMDIVWSIMLFIFLLWLWLDHTLLSSRYGSHGSVYKLLSVVIMACILGMTVLAPHAISEWSVLFGLLYAVARCCIILSYMWRTLRKPHHLVWTTPFLVSYGAASVVWGVSGLFSYAYVFWIAAFCIDIGATIFTRRLMRRIQAHLMHLPERLGLLTLIMLGEIFIAMVARSTDISIESGLLLGSALISICVLFVVYFRFVDTSIMANQASNTLVFLYGHVPLYVGLVLLAAGYKGLLDAALAPIFLSVGMLVIAVSYRFIKFVALQRFPKRQWWLLGGFVVILVSYHFVHLDVVVTSAVLSGVFALYFIIAEMIMPLLKQERKVLDW